MTEIKFESNYSAFAYVMTARIQPDVFRVAQTIDETSSPEEKAADAAETAAKAAWAFLAQRGIADICYRTVGSNVDKSLGVKSKKDGGMGRDGVEYSTTNAEKMATAVKAKVAELCADAKMGAFYTALNLEFKVTGKYEAESAKPSKEAEAKWTEIQGYPEDRFAKACGQLGIDPENYDDETGVAAVHRYLLEAVRKAREAAKSGL